MKENELQVWDPDLKLHHTKNMNDFASDKYLLRLGYYNITSWNKKCNPANAISIKLAFAFTLLIIIVYWLNACTKFHVTHALNTCFYSSNTVWGHALQKISSQGMSLISTRLVFSWKLMFLYQLVTLQAVGL